MSKEKRQSKAKKGVTNVSKKKQEPQAKTGAELIFNQDLLEVPPVVIKGGSINMEFPIDSFDDPDNGTKVKRVKHPDATREITLILITDDKHKFLSAYTLPAELEGKCIIRIFDNH